LDFWEKNLQILKDKDLNLYNECINRGRSDFGEPVITNGRINLLVTDQKIYFHDSLNPEKEVEIQSKFIKDDNRGLVAVVGIGLAYMPLCLLKTKSKLRYVLIIEPLWDVFLRAMELCDLSELFFSSKVYFFIGENILELSKLTEKIIRTVKNEESSFISHQKSKELFADVYNKAYKNTFSLISQINIDGATSKEHGKDFFYNTLKNLSLCHYARIIDHYFLKLKGLPCICVGAGPSLDLSISEIRDNIDKAVIISADSAFLPLIKNGIKSDIVTTIDFQWINREKLTYFYPEKELDVILFSFIKANPDIQYNFPAKNLVWCLHDTFDQNWFRQDLGSQVYMPGAFSTTHLALSVGIALGCNPIIIAGQDLGYTSKSNDHAANVVFHVKEIKPREGEEFYYETGINGEKVTTDRGFIAQRTHFENIIEKHPGVTFINSTKKGLIIKGATCKSIDALLNDKGIISKKALDLSNECDNKNLFFININSPSIIIKKAEILLKSSNIIRNDLIVLKDNIKKAKDYIFELKLKYKNNYNARIKSYNDLSENLKKLIVKIDELNLKIEEDRYLWRIITDLQSPFIRECDRLEEDVNVLRSTSTYLNWLTSELNRLEYLEKVRIDVIDFFIENITPLIKNLSAMKILLEKYGTDWDNIKFLEELFEIHYLMKAYGIARKIGEKIIELTKPEPEFLVKMGKIYANQLCFDKCREIWSEAVMIDNKKQIDISLIKENIFELWLSKAKEYFSRAEYITKKFIVRILSIYTENEKNSILSQELFPMIYDKSKDKSSAEDAIIYLESWFYDGQLKGVFDDRLSYLSDSYYDYSRNLLENAYFDRGLSYLSKACEINPEKAMLYAELGDLLFENKDYAGSFDAYSSCLKYLPDNLEVKLKAGDSLLLNANYDYANEFYNDILKRDKENNIAKNRLETIKKIKNIV